MVRERDTTEAERPLPDDASADVDRYTGAALLAPFVPTRVARRAVSVSIDLEERVHDRGTPVEFTVEFENRLPIPIEIPVPGSRRWGWTIDGELEATDERRFTRATPSTFSFRAGERKRASVVWNGRFARTREDGLDESVVPDPGEHEIRAFVATPEGSDRPSDATTIRLE